MMIHLILPIVCFTPVGSRLLTGRTCRGANGLVCCAGSWFNEASNNCEECPTGYFGFNCSKQCLYPSYGNDCQNDCTCEIQLCHHSHGCIKFKQSSPLQHDWILTSSSNVLYHSTNHASLGTELNVTRVKLSNVTSVYSTNESSVAPVTTTDMIYVGIILIGLFVLFFGMFAVTYVYQKCFRQRANMTNLQDKNIIDQLVQYKTLDFEIGEQEPVLSESRRSRLNTDTTYLYPVFERNTSYEETHNFPQVENDDPFVEATTSVQEPPPNVSVNRLDQDSLKSNCEPQQHVYVEILDNDVDAYENEDGNSVDNEDPTGARYSPDGREFDYVNVDD